MYLLFIAQNCVLGAQLMSSPPSLVKLKVFHFSTGFSKWVGRTKKFGVVNFDFFL